MLYNSILFAVNIHRRHQQQPIFSDESFNEQKLFFTCQDTSGQSYEAATIENYDFLIFLKWNPVLAIK